MSCSLSFENTATIRNACILLDHNKHHKSGGDTEAQPTDAVPMYLPTVVKRLYAVTMRKTAVAVPVMQPTASNGVKPVFNKPTDWRPKIQHCQYHGHEMYQVRWSTWSNPVDNTHGLCGEVQAMRTTAKNKSLQNLSILNSILCY